MLLLKSKPEIFILILLLLVSATGIADATAAFLPPATNCKDAYSVKRNIHTTQLPRFPLLNNPKCKLCHFANQRNEDQDAISVAKERQGDWTDATIVYCEKACPSGKSYLVRIQETMADQNCGDSLLRKYRVPGQFVQLRYKEEDPIFLAISSPPGKPYLEFLIKMSPRLPWLKEALIEGKSSIQLSHVMGDGFPISDNLFGPKVNQIFLIAAGSGIAPLKACIESGQLSSASPSAMTTKLYYGEWTTNDLCFTELYSMWKNDFGVEVIPVLSRQQQQASAIATRKNYAQYALERDGIVSPDKTIAIICGMDEMVGSTISILNDAGVPQDQILLNL